MPAKKPVAGDAAAAGIRVASVLTQRARVHAHTRLKPAGGSLVMTMPATVRKAMGLVAGTELAVSVEGSKIIIEAVEPPSVAMRVRRPKYTLDELLADANPDASLSDEERAWQNAAPAGREVW